MISNVLVQANYLSIWHIYYSNMSFFTGLLDCYLEVVALVEFGAGTISKVKNRP